MKNYKLITVIIICFVIACNKTSSKVDSKMSTFEIENENFDLFIKRFSNDSVFQKSRIIFPLKAETYDVETFTYNMEHETLDNWRFERLINFSNPKIINNIKTVKNQKVFLYQTEDTGIHIEYFFKLIKNRWVLYLIKDSSTQLKYSGSSELDTDGAEMIKYSHNPDGAEMSAVRLRGIAFRACKVRQKHKKNPLCEVS